MDEITINGEIYIKKSAIPQMEEKDGMDYVIVRPEAASVFAGYLESRTGRECVLRDARRIWYWDGAATLSRLAVDGTSRPKNCKFDVAVDKIWILDVVEIIPCTAKAKESIEGVPEWIA